MISGKQSSRVSQTPVAANESAAAFTKSLIAKSLAKGSVTEADRGTVNGKLRGKDKGNAFVFGLERLPLQLLAVLAPLLSSRSEGGDIVWLAKSDGDNN